MAQILNIAKLTSFDYGTVESDGTFPTSVTSIAANKIKDGTFTLTIPEQTQTPLYSEGSSMSPVILEGNREGVSFEVELFLDLSTSISDLLSGTLNAQASGTRENIAYNGSTDTLKVLAIRVAGYNSDGVYIDYSFPKVKLGEMIDGTIGKSDAKGYSIKGSPMAPFDTSGTEQDWFINNVGTAGA